MLLQRYVIIGPMQKLQNYFNPLFRLGNKNYSIRLPIIFNMFGILGSELFALFVFKDPNIVGTYIIFINVALIIYFSFRDGIRGGFISSFFAILYYFYIIQTRGYTGEQWNTAIETSFILMLVYLFLALIIGFLKQRIDDLVAKETEARQLAEDGKVRLEAILQQLPVGVLMVDGKTQRIEKNRQIETLFGQNVRSRLVQDKNYKSLYTFKDGKPLPAKDWPLNRAFYNGEIINGEELEYKRDNLHLFLRINASPIKNKKQEIIAAVSTVDDITSEKELEQRKDDFVSMASHELKTPITSLKIYIEVLLGLIAQYQDEKATKTLLGIKNQTDKLQGLVSDLLDVSRIQTGKLSFKKEPFCINDLLKEIISVLQSTTSQQIILKKYPHVQINADKFRIYQVVTNLLTNAIKYSPQGEKIWIEIQSLKNKLVVSVKDQGIGIDKNQQKRIFDRLYQVTDAKEKKFPGLGMGLYISREIIKRHRGAIWVEGEKGKGSTFYFSLPLN